MPVKEQHMAYGDWSLQLDPETPQSIIDLFLGDDEINGALGHIIITNSPLEDGVDPLSIARYTGVYRQHDFSRARKVISGSGMVFWLGDRDKTGTGINETTQDLSGMTFVNALTAALTGSGLQPGNIVAESGLYPGLPFLLATSRRKVEAVCRHYGAEYVATPEGKLDAGTPAALFPTHNAPKVLIKRHGASTVPDRKVLEAVDAASAGNFTGFATRKLLVQEADGIPVVVGEADRASDKRDIHNNLVAITDIGTESGEAAASGDARAAALLTQQATPQRSFTLSAAIYDIDPSVRLGDSVDVWDPDAGFVDMDNPVEVDGDIIYPARWRVTSLDWDVAPSENGTEPGVWFRETATGAMHHIQPYVIWDSGRVLKVEVSNQVRLPAIDSDQPLGPIVEPVTNPGAPPGIPDPPSVFGDERHLFVVVPTTTGGVAQPLNVTKMRVYASTTSGFTPDSTNYVLDFPVSRANILLGQTVKGRIPWMSDLLTYVRVAAHNGQEGPASIEVSDEATLFPSAAILNLHADKIDTGTISASVTVLSPRIIGGILETAISGQRVALEEGDVDRIKFYTGDVDETLAGSMRSFISGSGGTRQLYLIGQAPWISGGVDAARFASWSDSPDGTSKASAELSTYEVSTGTFQSLVKASRSAVSGWLGTANSRRWVLTPTSALMAYGSTSDPELRITSTQAELRSAINERSVILSDSAATLQFNSTAERIRIEPGQISFIGLDNVEKMDIRVDQINMFKGVAMNGWPLWLAGAGGTYRMDTGANPVLIGQQVRLSSHDDNVQIRIGGFGGAEADCCDNTGVLAFRVFTGDLVDACDEALKDEVGPAPWVLDDILSTSFGMQSRKSKPGPPMLGFAANKVPDYVTEELNMTTGKGKAQRRMRGSKPNASAAWALVGIQNLYQEFDQRIRELEKAR